MIFWLTVVLNVLSTMYLVIAVWRNHERRLAQEDRDRAGAAAPSYIRTTQAPAVSHAGAYPGVIRGWRAYRLSGDILIGGVGTRWTGRTLDATCAHARGHRVPDPHCECGIYVLPNCDEMVMWGHVRAEVVAWGEVIECCPHGSACTDANCVTGWRAEHVRIERLHSYEGDQYTAAMLRARYGVEVVADIPEPSAIGVTAMQVSSASYAYVQLPNTITYLGTSTP